MLVRNVGFVPLVPAQFVNGKRNMYPFNRANGRSIVDRPAADQMTKMKFGTDMFQT